MADAPRSILTWRNGPHRGLTFAGGLSGEEIEYIRADIARADADLAVAEAIRRAADMIEDNVRHAKELGREIWAMPDLLSLAPADALAEVQRLREAVEALVVVLDRNDKKGPIPDVEMMFCWLAAQGVRAAFQKIAQKGEAT